jgi:hypothetical protein
MNRLFCMFVAASLLLMLPHALLAQQSDAPVYKDGDWWRVKVVNKRASGVSVSRRCFEAYPEYMVKMVGGKTQVFGLKTVSEGEQFEAINCPMIVSLVLGKFVLKGRDSESREYLRFPMRVGSTWSARFWWTLAGLRGQWVEAQYEVQSWEKVKTPKGEFDAFKIIMYIPGAMDTRSGSFTARVAEYYYSPTVTAIVRFREESPPKEPEAWGTSEVIDFNVGQ